MFQLSAKDRITLDQWRAQYGLDKDSVSADPLFVDPVKRDYTVTSGSPALALRFVNIDQSKIGLLPNFPFNRD